MFRTGRFNTFIVFIETNGRGRKLNGMILFISSVREIVLNRFFNLKSFIAKQQTHLVMLSFIKNSNKKKQETWRFVMESLNSCSDSGCNRTDADIKKKLKDLLSRAKKDMSTQKNHPTGGGPPPKTSPYSDIIVTIFGEDSPAFVGLDGVDSGCSQPPEPLEKSM